MYGVSREELGKFYAGRTVLGHEVLPSTWPRRPRPVRGRPGAHHRHHPAGGQRGADGVPTVRRGPMTIDRDRIGEENEIRLAWHQSDLAHALDVVGRTGVDGDAVVAEVARFSAAAPSWAVGTGGTRFGRFPGGESPRHVREDRRHRGGARADGGQPVGQPPRAVGRPRLRGRRRPAPPRRGAGHRLRRHELQHLPGQPLDHPTGRSSTSSAAWPTWTTAPGGRRSSTTTT